MSIPFWQYPHCGTCTSIHACCNGCRAGLAAAVPRSFAHNAGSPSSVVTALPLTAATGVTHERISLPSNSTEHAPHCARPQPKRGPCRWSSLCRTYRRGVSRLAVTLCTRPFTLIFNLLAILTLLVVLAPARQRVAAQTQPREHTSLFSKLQRLQIWCRLPITAGGKEDEVW